MIAQREFVDCWGSSSLPYSVKPPEVTAALYNYSRIELTDKQLRKSIVRFNIHKQDTVFKLESTDATL